MDNGSTIVTYVGKKNIAVYYVGVSVCMCVAAIERIFLFLHLGFRANKAGLM